MAGKSLLVAGLGFGTAVGVALGALAIAPNMPSGGAGGDSSLREEFQKKAQNEEVLKAQADSSDSVLDKLAPVVVDGSLAQRPVLVISTGEASEGDVRAIRSLLKSADAEDAGEIKLTDEFYRQEGADKLLSLVTNALPAGAKLDSKKVDAGTHSGQALAAALLMDPKTTEPLSSTKDRANLLQALRDAGYIDYEDGTILPAQAVVYVGGKGFPGYYTDQTVNFLQALDEADGNTVVAARVEQAAEDRVIGKLREAKSDISTVDSIDRTTSRMAAVMAAKEQLDGGKGAYGAASSADAAAPSLPEEL